MEKISRCLFYLIFTCSLHGATYYLGSTGSDSNTLVQAQSISTPWLTLSHAVNSVACGDTILVIANGSYVAGDVTLPYFSGCTLWTYVQSTALAQFAPTGYRTNPTNDCPNPGTGPCNYGKLQFTSQGISAAPEGHGSNIASYGNCEIASITSNTITLGTCTQLPNLINGSQIEIEINTVNDPGFTATTLPVGLTILQHYYIINCGPGCGTTGSTLQLSATSGGGVLTIGACTGSCVLTALGVSEPLQFTVGSSTITSPDAFGSQIVNGTPITLASVGIQIFGTVPTPYQPDTIYYVGGISGRNFTLSATPGGAAIIATSVGLGPSDLANTNVPHHWKFDGLELVPVSGGTSSYLFQLGSGGETSVLGMVNHIEIARCWMHDIPTDAAGPTRAIVENGAYISIHDNYVTGMRQGESQAIAGWGSAGPTAITNNFLEAATEIILYGGNGNGSGVTNSHKLLTGNYFYKPPVWKITGICSDGNPCVGAPTVGVDPCWYDATDPAHAGGEWYSNSVGGKYQCAPNGTWATTTATVPAAYSFKNGIEHKNGEDNIAIGNLSNYHMAGAQSGQAYILHQNVDSGAGAGNSRITVMNNKALHVFNFITADSHCLTTAAVPCLSPSGATRFPTNHTIVNNIGFADYLACGVGFSTTFSSCGYHLILNNWDAYPEIGEQYIHNTVVGPDAANIPNFGVCFAFSASNFSTVPLDRWVIKNNITLCDFAGIGLSGGAAFAQYFTHLTATNNAMVNHNGGVSYASPGATNTFTNFDVSTTTNAAAGYANLAALDFHLTSSSPWSASNPTPVLLSDDGTDLGADVDLVNMATSGAAPGTPPWNASLRIAAGSGNIVFYFTAPTNESYSVITYNALPRIASNALAQQTDSAPVSISDGLRREIPLTGVFPSHVWYRIANASGSVAMVGDFWMHAAGAGPLTFTESWSTATAMTACDDKALTVNCTSFSAALNVLIPVNANAIRYVAPTANPNAVSMRVAP